MRYFSIILISVFCLASPTFAAVFQEDVRYYDVEILLFENLKNNHTNTETWPSSLEFEVPEKSLFIGSPYPGPLPTNYNPRFTFKPIKASTHQLQEEAKSLEEHKDYRVLYHRSWRQPGMERDDAISVKILKDIPHISATLTPEEALSNPELAETLNTANQTIPKLNKLQGIVKIILSRYLHVETDIQYTSHVVVKNPDDESLTEIKPQVYQLKQTRKMRSKELHYLDNPKIGLLVYITPVNQEPSN